MIRVRPLQRHGLIRRPDACARGRTGQGVAGDSNTKGGGITSGFNPRPPEGRGFFYWCTNRGAQKGADMDDDDHDDFNQTLDHHAVRSTLS